MARPGSERQASIESLKERIARDPLSRAFLQLAEEYRKEGRYQEAVKVCLEGLERHPTYHTARISLGRTHMEAGNLAEAKRAFSEVLELQPENHLAGKLLAEVQKKTADRAGAAETYRTILRYYPGDREVESLLADVLGGPAAEPALAPGRTAAAPTAAVPAAAVPPTAQRAAPAPPPPSMAPRAAPAPTAAFPMPSARSATVPSPPAPAPMPAPSRPADPAVDFQAGDLDGAGVMTAGPAESPADPWSTPPPALFEEDDSGLGDDALHTNTLAELYLRQGLVDKAVDVYRSMLRVDPDNQKAARRLADLVPGSPPPAGPAPAQPALLIVKPVPLVESRERPATPTPHPAVPVPRAKDDRIDRLERWLDRMRAGGAREANPR